MSNLKVTTGPRAFSIGSNGNFKWTEGQKVRVCWTDGFLMEEQLLNQALADHLRTYLPLMQTLGVVE